jgi:hypothetical protein
MSTDPILPAAHGYPAEPASRRRFRLAAEHARAWGTVTDFTLGNGRRVRVDRNGVTDLPAAATTRATTTPRKRGSSSGEPTPLFGSRRHATRTSGHLPRRTT